MMNLIQQDQVGFGDALSVTIEERNQWLTRYGIKITRVNIEAVDDKWIMKSNEETTVFSSNVACNEVELNPDNFYILNHNGEQLILYTTKTYDDTFAMYSY